jgi:hypothetical protein
VNQIGLRGLVHGRSESAHSGAGGSFVTTRHGISDFLAKRSDAAFGGAVTFRADFGLTNALLGRFGVGHGKKMTVVKRFYKKTFPLARGEKSTVSPQHVKKKARKMQKMIRPCPWRHFFSAICDFCIDSTGKTAILQIT